jgi:hypothetical protein
MRAFGMGWGSLNTRLGDLASPFLTYGAKLGKFKCAEENLPKRSTGGLARNDMYGTTRTAAIGGLSAEKPVQGPDAATHLRARTETGAPSQPEASPAN